MARKQMSIKTKYNGYRFRSLLEARWAVFFDNAKIKYEYEPQGYATNGEPYLPDFYLPQFDMYVEVKPPREGATEGIRKAWDSIVWGGAIKKVLILSNIPPYGDLGQWYFPIIYYGIDGVESNWWTFKDEWADDLEEDEPIRSVGCYGYLYCYDDCVKPIGFNENGDFFCLVEAKSDIELMETSFKAKKVDKALKAEDCDFDDVRKWVPRVDSPMLFNAFDMARQFDCMDKTLKERIKA